MFFLSSKAPPEILRKGQTPERESPLEERGAGQMLVSAIFDRNPRLDLFLTGEPRPLLPAPKGFEARGESELSRHLRQKKWVKDKGEGSDPRKWQGVGIRLRAF